GLLVRSAEAMRALAEVEIVALDKTGTLTRGEPEVVFGDDATLRIAAALERHSAHPVARAVLAEAARRGIPLPASLNVVEAVGVGVRGVVDGRPREVRRGAGPGEIEVVGVGVLRLRDALRPDAARTVAALKARGLRVVLVSGDHAEVAEATGRAAGVDEVVGAVGPEAKAAWVRAQPGKVLFVGDGVNDGPALAAAHAGIAMGAGAASSVLVADAVVAEDGLGPVLAGLRAAAATRDAVRGNAIRSVIYNASAVTAALLGLVNPLVAAVLMPVSSALVLWGAGRVERST
ncbi:MAG: HAD-IC family P-type ATPase, partial [Myxococcota bacterium]